MRLPNRILLLSLLLAVLLFATASTVYAARHARINSQVSLAKAPKKLGYAPGEVLVKFRGGLPLSAKRHIASDIGAQKVVGRFGVAGHKDTYLYDLNFGESVSDAVKQLKKNPDVLVAEPNYRRKSAFTPNDPYFSEQYGLENFGQIIGGVDTGTAGADIAAQTAWDFEQGYSNPIKVAVIDSGIDLNHPDLASKIWTNPGEVAANGIDDDGNGYIDDVHGYNFAGISHYDYNYVQPVGGLKYKFAQSIKGTGQPLTHIGLNLLKIGNPPGNLIISVRDSLNGSDLAQAVVAPSEVMEAPEDVVVGGLLPDYLQYYMGNLIPEYYKKLDVPVTLSEDQTYYIVVDTTITDAANYYLAAELVQGTNGWKSGDDIHKIKSDCYRDGAEYFQMDGGSWLKFSTRDLAFKTNGNAVSRDDNGHGTHVSGIIGAATNNAIGIAGVSPGAILMPLKVVDSSGWYYSSDAIEAIEYAADNGAKVINMSLVGDEFSVLEQLAVYYAASKGVTLVASAGNNGDTENGDDNAIQYPAGYDDVIGVGATDNDDVIAFFSNHNSDVDISAPGVNVLSTFPTYPVASGDGYPYAYGSGTSMASPMVAGVASLVLARKPTLNAIQVEKVLGAGAKDLTNTPESERNPWLGRDPYYGDGRTNAYRSLMKLLLSTMLSSAPSQPNGTNGWYTSFPSLSLEVDATGAVSYYSWDATDPVTTYTVPFQPSQEGVHELNYYSALGAAVEATNTQVFGFDLGLPLNPDSISSSSHTTGTASADRTIDVDFSGATDTVSGLDGYSVSWTKNGTETPSDVMTTGLTNSITSPSLSDGTWWLNLRTKDWAGNWAAAVHLGPFVIDGAPTTAESSAPSGPDGENSWFKTSPQITLTPDEVACIYYQFDSTSPAGWVFDLLPDVSMSLYMPEGQHILYYYSIDGTNHTETVKNSSFMKVDTGLPSGSVSINSGAAKTDTTIVSLTLSANDSVSGVAKMRLRNEGGNWSAWEAFSGTKTFWLTGAEGTKRVDVQFKDAAGNESAIVSDQITFRSDVVAPSASIVSPAISTNVSKTKKFKVKWSAADPAPSAGIASYDIKYKIGAKGAWKSWKSGTSKTKSTFKGSPGRTYYYKVRAKDRAGNKGSWSAISKTIVPFDQNSLISKRSGFNLVYKKKTSKFYLGTIRYSTHRGDKITYKVKGKSLTLIATKGPNRSRAVVKVDGKVHKINCKASKLKFRRRVFTIKWRRIRTHKIEVINKATRGKPLLDLDVIAVER